MPGAVGRLDDLTRVLRAECPWDREPDERSIVPPTVEEAYELADAPTAGHDAQLVDESRHRVGHAIDGVPGAVGWLVGAAAARQVWNDAPVAGIQQWTHDLAPEESPGRFAMEEEDGISFSFVDIGQPHAVPITVFRLVIEAGQVVEGRIGGALDVHGVSAYRPLG